jgi:hypothetical protein
VPIEPCRKVLPLTTLRLHWSLRPLMRRHHATHLFWAPGQPNTPTPSSLANDLIYHGGNVGSGAIAPAANKSSQRLTRQGRSRSLIIVSDTARQAPDAQETRMADPRKGCECRSRELIGPRRTSAVRECRGSGCWFKVALCDDAASFNCSLTAARLVLSSADGARFRISPVSDAAVSTHAMGALLQAVGWRSARVKNT